MSGQGAVDQTLDFEQITSTNIKDAIAVIVLLSVSSFAGHLNVVELGVMVISGTPLRLAVRGICVLGLPEIARYDDRHRMVGGLTGLAQISGLRGDISIIERTRLDTFYIDNWSLWLDLKVILLTVTKLIPQSQGIGGDATLKDIIAEVAGASTPMELTTVPAIAAQ